MTEELQLIPSKVTADGFHVPPAWSDGWVAETERGRAVALWWCLRAAESRAAQSRKEKVGFAVWTAAVEAVWWIVALEDGLIDVCGGERWKQLLRGSPDGQVLHGLRWLRHRHAHDVMVTASGGPVRDFYGRDKKPGEDYMFYLSPSPRWKPL